MTVTYAPGPWTVKGASIQAIDHGIRFSIARVGNAKLSPQGVAGTAKVMAAAPALLEALARIDTGTACAYSRNIARAAITKATGEKT